jgi:hypothetical protein
MKHLLRLCFLVEMRRKCWLLSSSSKLNSQKEKKRGKHQVDEVNIVLPWGMKHMLRLRLLDERRQRLVIVIVFPANNRQERNRGKHHAEEVNIVLLWGMKHMLRLRLLDERQPRMKEGCSLSSPSKLDSRQERKRGNHVDEVNIVLLWHEALAEAVLDG